MHGVALAGSNPAVITREQGNTNMKASKKRHKIAAQDVTKPAQTKPTHDEIARCAYSLWEQRGYPQNQELEIWFHAEAQLRQAPVAADEPV